MDKKYYVRVRWGGGKDERVANVSVEQFFSNEMNDLEHLQGLVGGDIEIISVRTVHPSDYLIIANSGFYTHQGNSLTFSDMAEVVAGISLKIGGDFIVVNNALYDDDDDFEGFSAGEANGIAVGTALPRERDGIVVSTLSLKQDTPKVVCLCGSTKFKDQFEQASRDETLAGNIVLSVGVFGHADELDLSEKTKEKLDRLHKEKILMADEILVINPGDYIGESTSSEIDFAEAHKKSIRYTGGE